MKKALMTAALVTVFSAGVQAQDEDQQNAMHKECKGYAMEEGIPAEEMESYIAQCVKDLKAAEADGESSEDADKE